MPEAGEMLQKQSRKKKGQAIRRLLDEGSVPSALVVTDYSGHRYLEATVTERGFTFTASTSCPAAVRGGRARRLGGRSPSRLPRDT